MIRQWLLNNPELVNTLMVAFITLVVSLITGATAAIRAWSANRSALDLTVTAIEKSKAENVKRAVRFGEGTTTKSGIMALHNSIERVSGKRPKRIKGNSNAV